MEEKKLVMNTISGTKNINSSMSLSVKAINKFASEFIKQGDTVEQAIKKATDKVERYQEGAINRLAKKYIALGKTITEAYSQAQEDIDIKWNGSQPKPSSIDNFVTSFFGSKFGKGLTVMTAMSMTVKTIEGLFKVANGISDQTLSVMDKLTGGMVSEKGLEYSLKNAIDFESVKTNIELLSKNVKGANGKEIYANATKLAKQTRFTEKEMASNAEWMLKGGINPTEQTLRSLANLASLKPELGGEHSGFAVFDALMGRVTSLKTNYGVDNEKLMKFQKTLSGNDKTGFLSQVSEDFCLHAAENRLTVCADDVLGPAAVGFLQYCVRIPELLTETICQCLSHRRLSTSGHADQDQIFHPAAQHGINLPYGFIGDPASRKPYGALLCLGNQHPKTVFGDQSPLFRFQKQPGPGRVVNHIQDTLQLWETVQRHGSILHRRIHPHRRRVYDDSCISMAGQIPVVILPGPGNANRVGAQLLQYRNHRIGCAAAA